MISTSVSSTVRNGYQAAMNRARVLIQEGKTEAEVVEGTRQHLNRISEIYSLHYDKANIVDKARFERYVESEYVGQTVSLGLRNTLYKVL